MNYTPYSPDLNQQSPVHEAKRSGGGVAIVMKLMVFLLIVVLGASGIYWLAQTYPDKARNILIAVDRFGITEVGAAEQARIRMINRLTITYEEKQVLIQRTVFLGATREMVSLALGAPVCRLQSPATAETAASEYWVYYIEGDRKPTLLTFQNNELVTAGKTSALDASCQ